MGAEGGFGASLPSGGFGSRKSGKKDGSKLKLCAVSGRLLYRAERLLIAEAV